MTTVFEWDLMFGFWSSNLGDGTDGWSLLL